MKYLIQFLLASLLTLSAIAAQNVVTIHVDCGSQNMVDHQWTVDFDVEVTAPDGSKSTEHVHVDVMPSDNAASIANALAHKLRDKTKLPFSTGPTSNPRSNEDKGRDLIMPENVTLKDVETRKRLDTPKPPEPGNPPGEQSWVEKDDHLKVFEGDSTANKVEGTPNRGTERTK